MAAILLLAVWWRPGVPELALQANERITNAYTFCYPYVHFIQYEGTKYQRVVGNALRLPPIMWPTWAKFQFMFIMFIQHLMSIQVGGHMTWHLQVRV